MSKIQNIHNAKCRVDYPFSYPIHTGFVKTDAQIPTTATYTSTTHVHYHNHNNRFAPQPKHHQEIDSTIKSRQKESSNNKIAKSHCRSRIYFLFYFIVESTTKLQSFAILSWKIRYCMYQIFSILVIAVECLTTLWDVFGSSTTMTTYRGVMIYSHLWFSLALYIAEIIFNIVLLIGAHKKKTRLLRVYYYYGITTTLASLVTYFVVRPQESYYHWRYYLVEASFVVCGVGIQVYLLLLVRSELLKIRHNSRLCYVNHAAEMVVDTPVQAGRNPF